MSDVRIKLTRDTARNIIKGARITQPPIILNDIIKHLKSLVNLEVRKSDLKEGLDGISTETYEAAFLGYNENAHAHRIRSTVAHELGHICLHHQHPGNTERLNIPEKQAENEAWCFARELLMPLPMFRKHVQEMRSIPKLHRLYWVSKDMLRVRIQELRLETNIWEWE